MIGVYGLHSRRLLDCRSNTKMPNDHDDAAPAEKAARRIGCLKEQLSVPSDFDTMGADEIREMFEGNDVVQRGGRGRL